ncbi:MAG: hypothetical protein KAG89_18225 [Fulvimarina manganoxydans]|uniref:hypothetical protein n=1 Tax=Fulvimarina manganoxydans TaxID=937218 RepID=UPI002354937F|nr:hypothetical protein [Fulvimarina manganoxydans]MCK5934100.1 hypothetical protein [Fulvimarina manganoxydans]
MNLHADNVVSFFRPRKARIGDWSQSELAQFYRVDAALTQAGLALEQERGVSDEGDPWLAFCHAETGEVFAHFARIGDLYIVESAAMPPMEDTNFERLVSRLSEANPLLVVDRGRVTRIYMHPAALLISAIAVLFYKTAPSEAADHQPGDHVPARANGETMQRGALPAGHVILSELQSVALLSSIAALPFLRDLAPAQAEDAETGEQVAVADLDSFQAASEINHSHLTVGTGIVSDEGEGFSFSAPTMPADSALAAGPDGTFSVQGASIDGADVSSLSLSLPGSEFRHPDPLWAGLQSPDHLFRSYDAPAKAKGEDDAAEAGRSTTPGAATGTEKDEDGLTGQAGVAARSTVTASAGETAGSSIPVKIVTKAQEAVDRVVGSGVDDDDQDASAEAPAVKGPPAEDVISVADAPAGDVDTVDEYDVADSAAPPPVDAGQAADHGTDWVIEQLRAFIEETPDYGIIRMADRVIMYDLEAVAGGGTQAREIDRFDFADGTSIVLIGLPEHEDAPASVDLIV